MNSPMRPSSKTSSEGTAASAILTTGIQVIVQALTLFIVYRVGLSLFGLGVLGVWSIASASVTLGRLGELGFAGAVPRLVAQHNSAGTHHQIPALIETAALAVVAGIGLLALLAFYPLLAFTRSVTTPETLPLVLPLLLGANLALVGTGIGSAFLGCLDGIGAFRARAVISAVSLIANPLTVFMLGEQLGPISLAAGASVQAGLMVVMGWLALRSRLPGLSLIPLVWSRPAFNALFQLGKFTQANSILILLFEPASRMLAGRFGGLEFAAIFDFAAKVSGNFRLLFSSFSQALIPFHAALSREPAEAQRLFASSTLLAAATASVVSAIALAMAPFFSLFSLAGIDMRFVGTFWLLVLGNLVNVIGSPSYAYILGGGAIAVSTKALALQACVFLGLAVIFEMFALNDGVAVAYAVAVSASGLYLLVIASRHMRTDGDEVISKAACVAGPTGVALAVLATLALSDNLGRWREIATIVPMIGVALACAVTAINLRLIRQNLSEILLFRIKISSLSN